jgi:hypothetical protein
MGELSGLGVVVVHDDLIALVDDEIARCLSITDRGVPDGNVGAVAAAMGEAIHAAMNKRAVLEFLRERYLLDPSPRLLSPSDLLFLMGLRATEEAE